MSEPARPSIAVVIPVRNRPDVVRRAIRSVQAQTVAVGSIIVVDDASTDHTPAVIAALAQEDNRIWLIALDERGGGAGARNRGIAAAGEDWIAFLDSDDEWLPDKLERQLAAVAQAGGAVACFTGHYGASATEPESVYRLPATVSRRTLLGINVLSTTSSALVRRATLIAVGGFDERLRSCQDWDLWIRLEAAGPLALISEPLVRFHQDGVDRITRDLAAVVAGHRAAFAKILGGIADPVTRQKVRAMHRVRLAQIMAWDFDRNGAAVRQALLALLYWPSRYKRDVLAHMWRRWRGRA